MNIWSYGAEFLRRRLYGDCPRNLAYETRAEVAFWVSSMELKVCPWDMCRVNSDEELVTHYDRAHTPEFLFVYRKQWRGEDLLFHQDKIYRYWRGREVPPGACIEYPDIDCEDIAFVCPPSQPEPTWPLVVPYD